MDTAVARGSRGLTVLLLLTVVVPALVISWGFENGRLAFVLYREPKLIAVSILGWSLVSAWLWKFRGGISLADVQRTLCRNPMPVLGLFVCYLMTTGFWVRVPQNYWYELNQYLLLFMLLVILLMWADRDPAVTPTVRTGLLASMAIVTVVGLLQLAVPLPFLTPINPQIGAPHPSLMGYKNPAALAVLGQIFLLAGRIFDNEPSITMPNRWRLLLGLLLAAETVYLASLGSRTSIMALVTAVLFLVILWSIRRPTLRRGARGVLIVAAALLLCGVTLTASEGGRKRAASMIALITNPASFLDSDRGAYFLNTLDMVRDHPMGVGLGDWQTHYPVHRRHDPTRSFSSDFQVRRAHSDHVQFLGEAGWPGLALWAAFLFTLIWITSREFVATGRSNPLFVAAQLIALGAAMTTDYVIEIPYLKAQFFLVIFLAIQARRPKTPVQPLRRSPISMVIALTATAIALGQITYHGLLAQRVQQAAHLERSYAAALRASKGPDNARDATAFISPQALGVRFASMYGHSKTFHKDWLILAHCSFLLQKRDLALAATERALKLHPNYPPAHLLMSRLDDEPDTARQWRLQYEHLVQGPTRDSSSQPQHEHRGTLP